HPRPHRRPGVPPHHRPSGHLLNPSQDVITSSHHHFIPAALSSRLHAATPDHPHLPIPRLPPHAPRLHRRLPRGILGIPHRPLSLLAARLPHSVLHRPLPPPQRPRLPLPPRPPPPRPRRFRR